jgi:phage-related protein (TIGR01555 family)
MGEVIKMRANDSLRSVVSGLGDPMRDKMALTTYGFQMLDEAQIANIYRSNWMGRKAVDIPALDAVRKGRDWQAKQEQIELIEAEQNRLGFWKKLLQALKKARLWGGAAIYIGTGDNDLMSPLDPARVRKGGIRYLTVLSRRDLSAGDIDQDVMSEFFGTPAYYEVTGATSMVRVHPSRFAIFVGAEMADPLLSGGINQGWGDSILEAAYTAMKNTDATAANIASLVFEANVDVFRIPDFMASLSDPAYAQRLIDRFMLAATAKGINRALILDKDEEYERRQVSFTTLPDVLQQFAQHFCGAVDIPLTRFFGAAPSGLGSNGEHSMDNYHDSIASQQKLEITPAIYRLDECLIRSALGSRPPEIFYTWAPLEQMSEKEQAEIGKMNAETAEILGRTGIFTAEELRTVVGNQLVESGFYPGLDQAMEETGDDFDLGEGDDNEDDQQQQTRQAANDASPRTLYVSRKVVNAADLIAWAKGQGFKTTLPADDLHVTIAYSRDPVDWMKVGESWAGELKVAAGGPRLMERFGEARGLLFKAAELDWRHENIKAAGASWDHPEYQSHITISYDPESPDLDSIEPYQGEIILGPELFAEVKEDWSENLKEE